MAVPVPVSIIVYAGSAYVHEISVTDISGAIYPLAGHTATMQVRYRYGAGTVLYQADTVNGHLVIDVAAGKVYIRIPASVSTAWPWRRGRYDLEIKSPAGVIHRLIEGRIKVKPEITLVSV